MAIAEFTDETAARLVATGIKEVLHKSISNEIKEYRDALVKQIDDALEEACKKAAEGVVAHVVSYRNIASFQPELHIHFEVKK